ncbi:hypothetical protein [Desulfoplanes sp.]
MSTRIVEMAELVFARKNLELPDLQKALEILEQAKKDVGRITPFLSAQ